MIEDYVDSHGVATLDPEFIENSSIEEIVLTIYYADLKDIRIKCSRVRGMDSDKVRLFLYNIVSSSTADEVERVAELYGIKRYPQLWRYINNVRVVGNESYEEDSYDYLANRLSEYKTPIPNNRHIIHYSNGDEIHIRSDISDCNKLLLILAARCKIRPGVILYMNGSCNHKYDVDLIAGLITKHGLTCVQSGMDLIKFLGIEDPINVAIEQRLKCKSTKSSRC